MSEKECLIIIASNIKAERVRAGYTQEEMAEKLDMSRETYIKYENGTANITLAKVIQIAYICGCPIDRFIMGI